MEPLSRRDILTALAAAGHDRRSAEAMLADHYHRTSRAVGVPTYQWGLDTSDLEAITVRYAWLRHGETLDIARARAGERAQQLAEMSGREDLPNRYREWARQSAHVWARRATPAPVFVPLEPDDDHPTDAGRVDELDSAAVVDSVLAGHPLIARSTG